jgi:hypothetical protein
MFDATHQRHARMRQSQGAPEPPPRRDHGVIGPSLDATNSDGITVVVAQIALRASAGHTRARVSNATSP